MRKYKCGSHQGSLILVVLITYIVWTKHYIAWSRVSVILVLPKVFMLMALFHVQLIHYSLYNTRGYYVTSGLCWWYHSCQFFRRCCWWTSLNSLVLILLSRTSTSFIFSGLGDHSYHYFPNDSLFSLVHGQSRRYFAVSPLPNCHTLPCGYVPLPCFALFAQTISLSRHIILFSAQFLMPVHLSIHV